MSNRPTKQRIADEFYALSQQRNIDKITVKDVVDACGISRQTFYYHFRDLFDVMEWTSEQLIEQTINQSIRYDQFVDALENFISQFLEYRQLIYNIIYSNHRSEGEQILFKAVHQLVTKMLKERLASQPIPMQDFELLANYHTFGLVGILLQYTGQIDFSPRKLAEQLNRIIQEVESNIN